jgi:pimeloyl-ACP methyl ester carboxylesterase
VESGTFPYRGYGLAFDVQGRGNRHVVLLPGVLFSRQMHERLARRLSDRGFRVATLDFLGHGESERPVDPGLYSMPAFGAQAVALLDHLGIDQAVVLGTSMGANVALEAALHAPDRIRGLILEMPVLAHAQLACTVVSAPMMLAFKYGGPSLAVLRLGLRRIPRGHSAFGDALVHWLCQDPRPSAAIIRGLCYGRTAPSREERSRIAAPALVIAQPADPMHPIADCEELVEDLRHAELVRTGFMLETRLRGHRLVDAIEPFLEACWPSPELEAAAVTGASG